MSSYLDALGLRSVGRVLVAGAAAALLAVGVLGCSSGGAGSQTGDAPAAEDQQAESTAVESQASDAGVDTSGKSWIDIIGEEQRDDDGILLTIDELAAFIEADPKELASDYATTVCSRMEEWAEFNDMDVINCEVGPYQGDDIPQLSANFYMSDDSVGVLTVAVGMDGTFIIQVRTTSGDGEPYRFTSDSIPDIAELERLMKDYVIS
ncbi:hypothetical protein [Enorma burkinafasonensis]|uniref:hypothetical protein n=1 Tax=Enorma burkinafasonensis TaxID=2590867 RepID=UPI0011A55B04|nr:hypothetical protein [Enorma burkinafasonensis]